MLLLLAALGVARSAYLDALGQGALPRDAASGIFDTVVALLRDTGRIVVIVAVLVAAASFLAGLPLRRYGAAGWTAFATSSRRQWVALHQRALLLGVGGAATLILLVASPLTGGTELVVALLAGAANAVNLALGAGVDGIARRG
jgi:hypothetical protein